jgi:hypothetical protein
MFSVKSFKERRRGMKENDGGGMNLAEIYWKHFC